MSQQGLRQASVRAVSGTTLNYEGDWHAMWDLQGIASGTFNERMLLYINEKLGVTYTNLPNAMQALAVDQGAANFSSMGTFVASLYEAEASTLFAAMLAAGAEPDDTRKSLMNTRIAALKAAGLWAKKDCDYMLAAHARAAAKINWKNPGTFDLTEVDGGNLTFDADLGFTGNGTSSYLKTGFNPATAGGQYALNSAHLGVYSTTAAQGDTIEIGARVGVNNDQCSLLLRNTSDVANVLLNQDSAALAPASTDGSGHFIGARRASNDIEIYRNGASLSQSGLLASQTVPSLEFYIGARNNNGTAGVFSSRQLSMATIGSGLTDAEVTTLYDIDIAYLQAIDPG